VRQSTSVSMLSQISRVVVVVLVWGLERIVQLSQERDGWGAT
jgi:hypothetical protein